jgi:hypothetical protein
MKYVLAVMVVLVAVLVCNDSQANTPATTADLVVTCPCVVRPVPRIVKMVVVAPVKVGERVLENKPVRRAVKVAVMAPVKAGKRVLENKPVRRAVKVAVMAPVTWVRLRCFCAACQ